MKLFLISQNEHTSYDTYDSAVVAAEYIDEARNMDPSGENGELMKWDKKSWAWCSSPDLVKVKYLGEAAVGIKQGVICASFNAG